MPFIKAAISEAQEASAVPEGEYDLRCVSAERVTSKKGKDMTKVLIAIESNEHPNASPINFYLNDITEEDEEKTAAFKALLLKRFLVAFEVPHEDDGFDTDDIPGCTASLMVKQSTLEKNADGSARENPIVINEIVFPRLQAEAADDKKKPLSGKPGLGKKGKR